MASINALNGINIISPNSSIDSNKVNSSNNIVDNFSNFFEDALNKLNDLQQDSQKIGNDFAAGITDNIHQAMIVSQKANISLQLALQVRNKILDAYSEIMRMSV